MMRLLQTMMEALIREMRVDDFKNALKISQAALMTRDPQQVAALAGAEPEPSGSALTLLFCNRPVAVKWPEVTVTWADNPAEEFPLTDAVIITHYLERAQGTPIHGEMAAYRQIPGGEFYFAAFQRRAEIPLAKTFGHDPALFKMAAPLLGGEPLDDYGDWGARFRPLPLIPVIICGYAGDEEFEASGQILFDKNIQHHLHIEDVAWLGSTLAYRLIGLARSLKNGGAS